MSGRRESVKERENEEENWTPRFKLGLVLVTLGR